MSFQKDNCPARRSLCKLLSSFNYDWCICFVLGSTYTIRNWTMSQTSQSHSNFGKQLNRNLFLRELSLISFRTFKSSLLDMLWKILQNFSGLGLMQMDTQRASMYCINQKMNYLLWTMFSFLRNVNWFALLSFSGIFTIIENGSMK